MMHHNESLGISHTGLGEGRIEVICGPMFSGKTEELLRRIRRARIAHQPIAIYKHAVDNRYHAERVTSHDANGLDAVPIASSQALIEHLQGLEHPVTVVAIDEAQFFDAGLPGLCARLADQGIRIIAAGLDLDFTGEPFGCMPELLARAEEVTKLHAVCVETGRPAHFSHRIAGGTSTVEVGEKDRYIPLTRQAFAAARNPA
jgi:thymidine kinase